MSILGDITAEAFDALSALAGQTITGPTAVAKTCVLGSVRQDQALRETGYRQQDTAAATMRRTDFVACALIDRSLVTVAGRSMKVRDIEDDPADALVRFRLEAEHTRAA